MTIYCITAPVDAGAGPLQSTDHATRLHGASFRAHDRDGHSFVIHRLRADPAVSGQVRRQAAAAAAVPGVSICRVIEVAVWLDSILVVREDKGESLRQLFAGKPAEVFDLVRIAIRLTETLEALHLKSVIHGSLASDCVFLSSDGEDISVGGFGYSRLLRGEPECLAPEVIRNGPESRTDVYAAGAILWEMATGQIAPAEPTPATQLRPDLPLIVDGIIRTALEPDPNKRYVTAGGMARALSLFAKGEASAARLERARSQKPGSRRRKRSRHSSEAVWIARLRWLKALAWVSLTATVLFAAYLIVPRSEPFGRRSTTKLTDTGDVLEAAISPDGSNLAVIRSQPEGNSLWLQPSSRQQGLRLVEPSPQPLSSPSFSRDGSTIYFVVGRPGTLHSIPAKGGPRKTLASNVIGAVIAPNEKKIAFLRTVGTERTVVVSNPDGSDDVVAYSRSAPADLLGVSWAAGGNLLAIGVFAPGEGATVVTSHPNGTYSQHLGWHQWPGIIRLAWLPTGQGLLATGPEIGGSHLLWRISYPDGTTVPISGLGQHSGVSLSANGKALVTVRTETDASIWIVPVNTPAAPKQITKGDRPDGIGGLDWVDNRTVVFATQQRGTRGLWLAGEIRDEAHVVSEPTRAVMPRVSPGGLYVAYIGMGQQGHRIWIISPEGKGLRDVTRTGIQTTPSFSPDARTIYYAFPMQPWLSAPDPGQWGVWRVPIEGGRPERISNESAEWAVVSPDGKSIAYRTRATGTLEAVVIPVNGGEPIARIPMTGSGQIGWTADGRSIVWARSLHGVSNLWAYPVAEGEPRQVTAFTSPGEIHSFAFSRDGNSIAVSRGRVLSDVVMLNDQSWF